MVFDLVNAFDVLWTEDSFIELYRASKLKTNKISMLYNLNQRNEVSIAAPVGETERVEIRNILAQGSTPAPLLCSNSWDSLRWNHGEKVNKIILYL